MRLLDLHVDWPLQYAPDATTFPPEHYPGVPGRLGQAEGYLGATAAAVVACYRSAADWAGRADPWAALGSLIARVEAEFSGRLLIGPADLDLWAEDRDGLCWAVLGVEGFDPLIRRPADLDRLPALFARGARVFQPVYGPTSALGGSSAPGDDRGLADLGIAFLEALAALAPAGDGPRPAFDLAHLNPRSAADALAWFEADAARAEAVIPMYSHGTPTHPGFDGPRAIGPDHLARLRALGGTVGVGVSPPFFGEPDQVRAAIDAVAAIPFRGRAGVEGIAIGTDFLGVDATLPGLANAEQVVAWARRSFDPATASALVRDNAAALFARLAGRPGAAPG